MPGIVGLITDGRREWAEARLRTMVERLQHEPFYITGTWVDAESGIYIGWTAHPGSSACYVPCYNEKKDVILFFSGQEYPDLRSVRDLQRQGHVFNADGTSYITHIYESDPEFPRSLNGLFHGLAVDRNKATATLFNDRYGMHRIYYHESKEGFCFATEAKAILSVRPDLRRIDPRGLGEFLSCGCVLENRTLMEGIRVLPPASSWIFQKGSSISKRCYFSPQEWEEQSPLSPEYFYQEVKNVISSNLERYFSGGDRIALALTGGLDTRIIMAWRKPAAGELPCYTFGGTLRETKDVRIARQIAQICRQSHETVYVGDDFLSQFPHLAERTVFMTEGNVDVSRTADLYVSRKARELAPVKIVGTYGSELLCRVVTFRPGILSSGLFRQDIEPYLEAARETYERVSCAHPVTFVAFRQSPWHHWGVLALEQTQLSVRSPFLDNDFVRTLFRAPQYSPDGDLRFRLVCDANPALGRIPTDQGIAGTSAHIVNRASRTMYKFASRVEYGYDYRMPNWIAGIDRLASRLHPERLFLGRFTFEHYRVWYRDSLAGYVREILLDPLSLSRPYIERKGLESVVQGHLRGSRNHTQEIHKLLTLELFHRLFIDAG